MIKNLFESMKGGAQRALGGFGEFSKGLFENTGSGWGDVLQRMTQLYGKGEQNEALLDRMLGQGKTYLGLLEQLYQGAKLFGDKGTSVDFKALAEKAMAELQKYNPLSQLPMMQTFSPFAANNAASLGQDWLASLQKMMPGQSGMPNFLDFPAFGIAREHQERQIELIKHLQGYQAANQAFNDITNKSIQLGIERMQSKLAERSEPGRELDSMKAVYDLWIDSLEEAFAEVALSPDYQRIYGELVDSQMRVRANIQKQVELTTGQLGMPTRKEMDSVHQRLTETRRQLRQVDLSEMQQELAELRAEVSALKQARGSSGSAVKAASAVKATVQKASTKAKAVLRAPAQKAVAKKAAAKKVVAKSKLGKRAK